MENALEHGLADEVLLLVYPILPGTGNRLLAKGTPPREPALVGTKAAATGVRQYHVSTRGPSRIGSVAEPPA